MNDFTDMLSKAKAMQDKMKEAQDQIKKIEVEGHAGGDLVKVVLTGDYELKSIYISEEAKKEEQEINTEEEFIKIVMTEKNRQLNEYSIIYYKKIKKQIFINEK